MFAPASWPRRKTSAPPLDTPRRFRKPGCRESASRPVACRSSPADVLRFLLASRYCEVDRLLDVAETCSATLRSDGARAGGLRLGSGKRHLRLPVCAPDENGSGYLRGSPGGLPRFPAFGHYLLPLYEYSGALCDRISGRYRRARHFAMDFSAWFEAYLDGRWWTFDARNNIPRIAAY